jgi:hypothetical protein
MAVLRRGAIGFLRSGFLFECSHFFTFRACGPVFPLRILGKRWLTPCLTAEFLNLTPPGYRQARFVAKSVKIVDFTLFGSKFSPRSCAPICPFSPRKRTFAGCGVANGTTGADPLLVRDSVICITETHTDCVHAGEHTRRMGSLLDERSRLAKQLESLVLGSHTELTVLTAKIESNVAKEYASHSFVEDFLTLKV